MSSYLWHPISVVQFLGSTIWHTPLQPDCPKHVYEEYEGENPSKAAAPDFYRKIEVCCLDFDGHMTKLTGEDDAQTQNKY